MNFFELNKIINEQKHPMSTIRQIPKYIKKKPTGGYGDPNWGWEHEKHLRDLRSSSLHTVERSGLSADERYFIGWKKDLPSNKVNDKFADGQYGSYKDAVKFPSKDDAEKAVARIEDKDGYNVYANQFEE